MLGIRTPVVGRSAWRPQDFRDRDAYTVNLTDAQIWGLDAARAAGRRRTDTIESMTAEDFALGADVAAWRDGRRPLVPAVHAYKGTQGIAGRGAHSTYYTGAALPRA
jgi:hypothetical protein